MNFLSGAEILREGGGGAGARLGYASVEILVTTMHEFAINLAVEFILVLFES
jgi:hypothetical protein